jgi:hypothetical protein
VKLARQLALPAVVAAVVLLALLALRPLATPRAFAIWIVVVAAIVLLMLVRHSRGGQGLQHAGHFEAALRRRKETPQPPVDLLRMERELELGIADATHAHRRLLPLLRAAATARLDSRHGIELDRRPDAAEALLGEEVWELLRPDRPEPTDRHGPGVPRASVAAVIEQVESL